MTSFEHTSLIRLKNSDWLERQKVAGRCVAGILKTLNQIILDKPPHLSLRDLEAEAVKQFKDNGCQATFLGYKGFPGAICLSVNKQIVHGIPSDYLLQDGDVVKFDLGATFENVIADAAATQIYGTPKSRQHVELIETCKEALNRGIRAIQVGKQLGVIGYAIHKYVTNTSRFGLITQYGGHGICMDENGGIPHAPPFVPNKSRPNEGIRIQPGLAIAIEPMLVCGDATTSVAKDGWTVMGSGVAAHFEHSIYVDENKVHILTEW